MSVRQYFADISEELQRRSDRVRFGFATHRLTAGENREGIVASFLRDYLPKNFGVDTGLILAKNGAFSQQADLLVVDQAYNAPLYPEEEKRLWLVEAVYSLIEVKTHLSPSEIRDAVRKCCRFKNLPRQFADVPTLPKIPDSLFVLWAWEAPAPSTVKKNLLSALQGVPQHEHPDFLVVPGSVMISGGAYRRLSQFGQPGSSAWVAAQARLGGDIEGFLARDPIAAMQLDENTLLTWLVWFTSWLKAAGHRSAPLQSYLGEADFGHMI